MEPAEPAVIPNKKAIVKVLQSSGMDVTENDAFEYGRIGEGRGFVAHVYRVILGERAFAVKITDHRRQQHIEGIERQSGLHENVHGRELAFYGWLEECLRRGEIEEADVRRIPRFYGGRPCGGEEGFIVMQDLSERMTTDVDYVKGYSPDIVISIVKQIVGLQTAFLSASTEPTLPDSTLLENAISDLATSCIHRLPQKEWLTPEMKLQLLDWAQEGNLNSLQREYLPEERGMSPVLVHRDLWPNNLLFEKTTAAPEGTLLAIVDWQCVTEGVALLDVASAIGVCMTTEDRRRRQDEIVRWYCEEIMKNVHRFKKPFGITFNQAQSMYTRCLRFAALQLAMTIVFNPQSDTVDFETGEGRLSARLRGILEDALIR